MALTCILAGCGVSVTVAGQGPSGSPTGPTDNPGTSGSPTGGPTGGPTTGSGGGGGSNLAPMSLSQLDAALLTTSDVGSGYTLKYHYDTTHATTTGLGAIATVQNGDASCADVVNSFDPIPTAGNVKSTDWAFSDYTGSSSSSTSIAEWIGSFSGTGAQQAMSTLKKDYGTCAGFTVSAGGTTNIGASEAMSTTMLGTSSNFGSPTTADMILWGTASTTSAQTYAATVVGVFGGNLAAITAFDSSFQSAAALAGQAATAAAAKLGSSGNAV